MSNLLRHKIGCARTIQTAILVTEYLRRRFDGIGTVPKDSIRYVFTDATDRNGWWTADIIVDSNNLSIDDSGRLVDECRAFVAGRGEIWI